MSALGPPALTNAARKSLPIKRSDGEPLTRRDIQFDLLDKIFSDDHAVFTNPDDLNGSKLVFRDLYVNSIMSSGRASKALKDKMVEVPDFATDFAKLALLTNVSRVNTTMAFFPEMKTQIRTYHPIPALNRTNGNLQDAPRIKNILKACLLEAECNGAPSTPLDIISRSRSGVHPPTSVVNLIFVMASHAAPLGQMHFDPAKPLDFLDLFLPIPLSSTSRARAFLWLCFHYLESNPDPFISDASTSQPSVISIPNPWADPTVVINKIPPLVPLTPTEMEAENVDPPEEIAEGERMIASRKVFQDKILGKKIAAAAIAADLDTGSEDFKPRGKKVPVLLLDDDAMSKKEKKAAADKARRARLKAEKEANMFLPPLHADDISVRSVSELPSSPHIYSHPLPPPPLPATSRRLSSKRPASPTQSSSVRYRTSQNPPPPLSPSSDNYTYPKPKLLPRPPANKKPRTMLQHAWRVATTTDALLDSDEELGDEPIHVQADYLRRLDVIDRLRMAAIPQVAPLPPEATAITESLPPLSQP